LHNEDGTLVVPVEKLATVTKAVVEACDASDGLKDGLIGDPRRCSVDLAKLLPAAQAEAIRKVWEGVKNPRTGQQIFTGWPMGSEDTGDQSWRPYLTTPREPMRADLFRYFLFHDPNWNYRTIDWDRDLTYADRNLAFMNAIDPDLGPFKRNKGKLLMYAGWADAVVPPQDTVAYYEAVTKTMGGSGKTQDFARLFMAPGMGHCAGGPGPNQFDAVTALDEWVTKGKAPAQLAASHSTTEPSIAPVPFARIRWSRDTKDPAASTKPRTSPAQFQWRRSPRPAIPPSTPKRRAQDVRHCNGTRYRNL